MPSYLAALRVLLWYREQLIQLSHTPSEELNIADIVGKNVAIVVLKRLKRPAWQALTFWRSKSDLVRVMAYLDSLSEYAGRTYGPPAEDHSPVKDLKHRHTHAGNWAKVQARHLREEIYENMSRAKLMANGIRLITDAFPDWPWRLTKEACRSGTPVAVQLWGSEITGLNSRAARREARRRLSELLGFDLNDQHVGIRLLLTGLDSPEANPSLTKLWWKAAKLGRRITRRPESLPSLIPSVTYNLRDRKYFWPDSQSWPRVPENLRRSGRSLDKVAVLSIVNDPTYVLIIPGDFVSLAEEGEVVETEYFSSEGQVVQIVAYIDFSDLRVARTAREERHRAPLRAALRLSIPYIKNPPAKIPQAGLPSHI
jgi:hypothetical protein